MSEQQPELEATTEQPTEPPPPVRYYLHQTYSVEFMQPDGTRKIMWLQAKVPISGEGYAKFSATGQLNVINDTDRPMLVNGQMFPPGAFIGRRQFIYDVPGTTVEEAAECLELCHAEAEAAERAKHEAEVAASMQKAKAQAELQRIVVPGQGMPLPSVDQVRRRFKQ